MSGGIVDMQKALLSKVFPQAVVTGTGGIISLTLSENEVAKLELLAPDNASNVFFRLSKVGVYTEANPNDAIIMFSLVELLNQYIDKGYLHANNDKSTSFTPLPANIGEIIDTLTSLHPTIMNTFGYVKRVRLYFIGYSPASLSNNNVPVAMYGVRANNYAPDGRPAADVVAPNNGTPWNMAASGWNTTCF